MTLSIPRLLPSLLLAFPVIGAAAEGGSSILVLDASGSMWGQIGGKPKVEIARQAVASMLKTWPAGDSLGLIAYGHRRKGDCADIELIQPPQPLNAAAFLQRVNSLQAKGMTPITASVRLAAEQLKSTERKATVILVSDGEETCKADPCALGKELEASGVDFTAHVIGFDLPEGPARQQLQCLAGSTGGQYLEARNAGELNRALESVTTGKPVAVKAAEQWIPGHALEWSAGEQIDGASAESSAQVIEFTVDQTAKDCQAQCLADAACAGWHYEPTGSFFIDYPRCHLQGYGAPMLLRPEGEGWVAGVKAGVKLIRTPTEP